MVPQSAFCSSSRLTRAESSATAATSYSFILMQTLTDADAEPPSPVTYAMRFVVSSLHFRYAKTDERLRAFLPDFRIFLLLRTLDHQQPASVRPPMHSDPKLILHIEFLIFCSRVTESEQQ